MKHPSIEFTEDIREQCFGIFEGQPSGSDKEFANKETMGIRYFKPEKGESLIDVNQRASSFLDFLIENFYLNPYSKENNFDKYKKSDIVLEYDDKIDSNINNTNDINRILVVTHSNFISEFINVLLERKNEEIQLKHKSVNSSVYAVKIYCKICKENYCSCYDKSKNSNLEYEFILYNDSTHLIDEIEKNLADD